MMDQVTVDALLRFIDASTVKTLDLTGGAPELNPLFRSVVTAARKRGVEVIDRCNLTVLFEPGQEATAEFLADNKVKIVASLPCYMKGNVDNQRGDGTFDSSLKALRLLNSLGYGKPPSELTLDLVFNPQGPVLPPPQETLEQDYKRHLGENFGITFNSLLSLANMPIQRFGSTLISRGEFNDYMALLKSAHKDENVSSVMCRSLISVDWQGYVYDCDFNQMLEMPLQIDARKKLHIADLIGVDVNGRDIQVAAHCFGCTAGQGSSCGGALD